jgi:hypothetical protein
MTGGWAVNRYFGIIAGRRARLFARKISRSGTLTLAPDRGYDSAGQGQGGEGHRYSHQGSLAVLAVVNAGCDPAAPGCVCANG